MVGELIEPDIIRVDECGHFAERQEIVARLMPRISNIECDQ